MSERFPGGIISKTAPVPTGPYENGTAPGVWTLDQQAAFVKQGIWPIAGNVPNYIEDVFQTWVYTGTSPTSQTITNGIDLAGKGGMIWSKDRAGVAAPTIVDTVRGRNSYLKTDQTSAAVASNGPTYDLVSFNSNGYTLGQNWEMYANDASNASVGWTFRKQPKFFDVVTYTGTGSARTIAHSLGSVPGCMIVKATVNGAFGAGTYDWPVYHRSLGANKQLRLNTTGAESTTVDRWNATAPTSSVFTVGNAPETNENGVTYVAYLFAHNAGGFGLSGTDNVISCGTYTGTGATNNQINLGYEPQWVLIKNITNGSTDWIMGDIMRGMPIGSNFQRLQANLSNAEDSVAVNGWVSTYAQGIQINGTGNFVNGSGEDYIYIAIRRGPMAVPTDGTKVFQADAYSGTGASNRSLTTLSALDFSLIKWRTGNPYGDPWSLSDRLRGIRQLYPNSTSDETGFTDHLSQFGPNQNTVLLGNGGTVNGSAMTYVNYAFRRAPSFFDEVCYTGTGSALTLNHNLTVSPELIIYKARNLAGEHWGVWVPAFGFSSGILWLDTSGNVNGLSNRITGISATTVSVGTNPEVNNSGTTYAMYLFATCAGVSKVGSYTGTGTTQTINCGFTAGSRFVLVKSTSAAGNWYVWDSTRGIVAGDDPYLIINSTAAEVTNTDWVDTTATGFELSNAGGNLANSSGVSYIFLAIA